MESFVTPRPKLNKRSQQIRKTRKTRSRNRISHIRYRPSNFTQKIQLRFNDNKIDIIIREALQFFRKRVPNNQSEHPYGYAGVCGTSQSAIYWSAIKNKVKISDIKLLNVGTFVPTATHAFALIRYDKEWYICDLAFKQFIFNEEEVDQLPNDLNNLYTNKYVLLTPTTVIHYFKYCSRQTANYTKTNIPRNIQYGVNAANANKVTNANIIQRILATNSDKVDNSCRSIIHN